MNSRAISVRVFLVFFMVVFLLLLVFRRVAGVAFKVFFFTGAHGYFPFAASSTFFSASARWAQRAWGL